MAENVLHIENITMQFGGVVAVNNLNLDVNKGEIIALIGPNGAGKTTAFNCVTGVYEPTNGKIDFMGETIVENYPQGKMKKIYAGENIAAGQVDPQAVVTDWMNSPEHKDNILTPEYTHMGASMYRGGNLGIYWAQEFAG